MRDGVRKMDDGTGDDLPIRRYLLGNLEDDAALSEIEMLFLKDDDFSDKVASVENQLIEEFLDDELDPAERASFVKHFLASPERRRQLRLTKDLRDYSAQQRSSQPERSHGRSLPGPSPYWLRFGFAALILAAAAFGVWRLAIHRSDTDLGVAELRRAYAGTRPFESRTTAFNEYAPFTATRGPSPALADPVARDRSERYLMDAVRDNAGARAHQELALLYLAEKRFDRAAQELDAALAAAPNDAAIQSDAGAVNLELAKSLDAARDGDRVLTALNESLKHLNAALAIDPRLAEARFNRALCLEMLKDTEQAKLAWTAYLEIDPNSKWADEARKHLQALGQRSNADRSAADLESDLMAAYREKDAAAAASLVGANRELISDKYLPTRLAASYINAPDERLDELLGALKYVGNVEKGLTGDPFANDIALFYASAPPSSRPTLIDAERAVRDGLQDCIKEHYDTAVEHFELAMRQFAAAGNKPESELASYLSAYAYFNLKKTDLSLEKLRAVQKYASGNGYRWLEALSTHWIGICSTLLGQPTDARLAFEHALDIAVSMKDSYSAQRNRIELARMHSAAGQSKLALKYLFDIQNNDMATSLRQHYRNLSVGADVYLKSGMPDAAGANSIESVVTADLTQNPGFIAESRVFAGISYSRIGNDAEARRWFSEAADKTIAIASDEARSPRLAFLNLHFGELELRAGNTVAAQQHFADALGYYDSIGPSALGEAAHVGLLQAYLKQGNTAELEAQIAENIRVTEQLRTRVRDADQRSSYFESKQSIYDIAADFEFGRGNLEKAYDYSEMVGSRMLLDRMTQSGKVAVPNQSARPLSVLLIRQSMPPDVQIVQYSVLREKVLIWVIARDKFEVVPIAIAVDDLDRKVKAFALELSQPSHGTNGSGLARELYDLLIAPVRDKVDLSKQICIVPDKALFNVSFAALRSPEGESPLSRSTFFFAPSSNTFLRSTAAAEKRVIRGGEKLLAVGDPAFDHQRFATLAYVPEAAAEAKAVAAMYPGAPPLTGPDATKQAFLAGLSTADVVHFAGHYVTQPEAPLSSFLLFSGEGDDPDQYTLTSGELLKMNLTRTRLVVLSACQTGVESYLNSEGMLGLSRTLLADGVPVVVASQWRVDSQATAELMTRFHRYRLEPNTNSAAALRRAQLDLATDPTGRFNDPYYWAGFAVFSGSANF